MDRRVREKGEERGLVSGFPFTPHRFHDQALIINCGTGKGAEGKETLWLVKDMPVEPAVFPLFVVPRCPHSPTPGQGSNRSAEPVE